MKKTYGFFNTFISVCSGTAIFPEIVKFPFMRMVWHLFILAVLGGIINVAFRYHPFNVVYEESCTKLQKKFGNLHYSEKGILPTENPDKRGTVYMDDFQIDYLPEIEDLKDFKPEDDYFYGIAWTPFTICVWLKYDNQPAAFMPLLIPVVNDSDDFQKSLSLIMKKIKGSSDSPTSLYEMAEIYKIPPKQFNTEKIPFRNFETNIIFGIPYSLKTLFLIYVFAEILINCLIASPIYILIFSMFSYFLGKSNMLSLKFSQLFIVGIYTGFPGIVIAILYSALRLPYLDFQSVFLISYLFYSFPVFGRLRFEQVQKENPEKNENSDQDN